MSVSNASTVVIIAAAFLLQGCAALAVGTAATGATAASDRRTTGTFIEDQSIEWKAAATLNGDAELDANSHINVTSYNEVVLLSGEVISEDLKRRAETHVRGIPKVRDVHNELAIGAPRSLLSRGTDSTITAKVKTNLFTLDFDPTRIKVVTEGGVVYLMGLVTRAEADTATDSVSRVGGVVRVVKVFEYID